MKKLLRITTVPISLKILLKDQLRFMNKHFEVVGVSSHLKELEEVEKDEGIRVVALDMSREITPFKDLLSLFKMILLFLREKPDIVHTHTPKAGIIGMLASWICRVPHRLHTVAGLPVMEAEGKRKQLLFMVEKLTYFCASRVYPNSYGLQEYILQHSLVSGHKLKVIGHGSSNGIDTSYFSRSEVIMYDAKNIRTKYQLKNKFVFCFVGRVVRDKGVNELLDAFDKLSLGFDNVRLFILGDFESDLDPISLKSQKILQENKNILYMGFQDDIRAYLAASDAFVLPTYREGFPNVVLQAASMELPCIVSDINGCNEIITHNKNGLIVPPKSKKSLFEAMKSFLQESELAKKLSLNSRNDIIKKYDRKNFHNYLLQEYKEVLKNG